MNFFSFLNVAWVEPGNLNAQCTQLIQGMALVQGIDTDVVIGVTDTLTERSSIIRDEAVMWQPLLRSAVIKEHDYSVSVVYTLIFCTENSVYVECTVCRCSVDQVGETRIDTSKTRVT